MKNQDNHFLSVLGCVTGVALAVAVKDANALCQMVIGGGGVTMLTDSIKGLIGGYRNNDFIRLHPNELNHNLQKLLLKALKDALRDVELLYEETLPEDTALKPVKEFLNKLILLIPEEFNELVLKQVSEKDIQGFLHGNRQSSSEAILKLIDKNPELEQLDKRFVHFFKKEIIIQLRLHFTKELKDSKNRDGWIAFQKLMLEDIHASVSGLLNGQQKVQKELKSIKNQNLVDKITPLSSEDKVELNKLLKELNNPERMAVKFDKALKQMLGELLSEMREMRSVIDQTHAKITLLLKAQSGWLDARMVIAYSICCLAVVFSIAYYFQNKQKPFSLSVKLVNADGRSPISGLANYGKLILHLSSGSDSAALNKDHQIYFKDIPGANRGTMVRMSLSGTQGDAYVLACDTCTFRIDEDQRISLMVVSKKLDQLSGVVTDESNRGIKDARVFVQRTMVKTDEAGFFKMDIPPEQQRPLQKIKVIHQGYKEEVIEDVPIHLQSGPISIKMLALK